MDQPDVERARRAGVREVALEPRDRQVRGADGQVEEVGAAWRAAVVRREDGRQRRLASALDRAQSEIALLTEELDIKDTRWSRLPPRRRPFYGPVQRMRILQLKAARG